MKQALVQRTEFMFTRQRVETIAHDTPSEAEVLPIAYSLSLPQDLFSRPYLGSRENFIGQGTGNREQGTGISTAMILF